METHLPSGQRRCRSLIRSGPKKGQQCTQPALASATGCRLHCKGRVRAQAAVKAEVVRWGLLDADPTIDPGAVLLKLVAQSAARAEHYAQLLAQAYDAAERIREAHEAMALVGDTTIEYGQPPDENGEGGIMPDPPAVQTAKRDLERIFNIGGPAALIGLKYSATQSGGIYAVGEAIRGLVELEAAERERCASWAAKAIAAGLAERTVRLEERRAAMAEQALMLAFADVALDEDLQLQIAGRMAEHLVALEAG